VSPDDFYVTTIYPTEVRINGEVKVENQRMDGAIAYHTPTGLVARCKLLRDEVGEQVVVDVQGIRTIRKPESGTTQHPGIQLYVSWGFQ